MLYIMHYISTHWKESFQYFLRSDSTRKEPTKIQPNVQTRGAEILSSSISFKWEMLGRADFIVKENLA